MFKRLFDICGSAVLLLMSLPIYIIVGIAIKLDDAGPIFFFQQRVGRGGKKFWMIKFRKMRQNLPTQGAMLTQRFDPRLTRIGRWLERTKLDELPQFFNVLRGDMSLIGPRPEVEKFVDLADPRWQKVLSVRPAIFGPTQIKMRNESELYPVDCPDIEDFYRTCILPIKLESDGDYVSHAGLLYDMRLLLGGLLVSLFGTVTGQGLRRQLQPLVMLHLDLAIAAFTFFVAWSFRMSDHVPEPGALSGDLLHALLLVMGIRGAVFLATGLYRRRPSSLTYFDFIRISKGVAFGSVLILLLLPTFGFVEVPRSVVLADLLLLTVLMSGKAYVAWRVVRARYFTGWRLSFPMSLGIASGGGAAYLAIVAGLIAGLNAPHLATVSWLSATMVILGATAVRAYGLIRHAFAPPAPGWSFLVVDLPAMVFTSMLGSLMIVAIDTMTYANLLTPSILAIECVLSPLVLVLANRVPLLVGHESADPPAPGPHGPAVLFVGITAETEVYLTWIDHLPEHIRPRVAGLVTVGASRHSANTINHITILGPLERLDDMLDSRHVDLLMVAPGVLDDARFARLLRSCRERQINCRLLPDLARLFDLPLAALGSDEYRPSSASGDSLLAIPTPRNPLEAMVAAVTVADPDPPIDSNLLEPQHTA